MKKKRIIVVGLSLILVAAVIAVCYVSFGTLSNEAAQSIALSHAGVSAGEVDFIHADRDFDDGVLHYDVEFHVGSREYDYEIHAKTGEILSTEKDGPDRDDYHVNETSGNSNQSVTVDAGKTEEPAGQNKADESNGKENTSEKNQSLGGGNTAGEGAYDVKITKEEAEAIALAHAGLTADQVRFDRTEYDGDDRYPEYEIEFYCDGWEYQYEVHAETGEIIQSEKDFDD